jgi:thymidylate synthase
MLVINTNWIMEFQGINSFLVGVSNILIRDGRKREVRGHVCYELPYPVLFKITNPRARLVTIAERVWNPFLPYVESLWMGLGRNDLAMPSSYLPRLSEFSDDGTTLRAAYGPRFRYWQGGPDDYNIGQLIDDAKNGVDQFKFVIELLKKNPASRQAIITIGDPEKDCFSIAGYIKETLDRPCTRNIQFIINDGKLDMYVHMRSNDFIWGSTGVNIFNFTFLQEIFSGILNVEVGVYYHMVNNFHYYEKHREKIERIADVSEFEDFGHTYSTSFKSLNEYDNNLKKLETYENKLRNNEFGAVLDSTNDFVMDWGNVIRSKYETDKSYVTFKNPILSGIINKNNI